MSPGPFERGRSRDVAGRRHYDPVFVTALRLNLGCGRKPLTGFVNVDLLDEPGVDVFADVGGVLPFEAGTAELIYASHVLEHLPTARVPDVLREWRRVLKPGGRLLIAVPDLELIAKMLTERPGWFTPPHEPWTGAIYGGQKDELDFHKTGFTGVSLAARLTEAGFGSVKRVERFDEIAANDGSWSLAPFGVNVSLNMEAVAGDAPFAGRMLRRAAFEYGFDSLDRVLLFGLRASSLVRARLMERRRRQLEDAIHAPGG